jgi:hypothetical protein
VREQEGGGGTGRRADTDTLTPTAAAGASQGARVSGAGRERRGGGGGGGEGRAERQERELNAKKTLECAMMEDEDEYGSGGLTAGPTTPPACTLHAPRIARPTRGPTSVRLRSTGGSATTW